MAFDHLFFYFFFFFSDNFASYLPICLVPTSEASRGNSMVRAWPVVSQFAGSYDTVSAQVESSVRTEGHQL